jgi:hypothetical protein
VLTPREYARDGDVGYLFCEDENGAHFTVAGLRETVELMIAANQTYDTSLAGVQIPAESFPWCVRGWPDEWPPAVGKQLLAESKRRIREMKQASDS